MAFKLEAPLCASCTKNVSSITFLKAPRAGALRITPPRGDWEQESYDVKMIHQGMTKDVRFRQRLAKGRTAKKWAEQSRSVMGKTAKKGSGHFGLAVGKTAEESFKWRLWAGVSQESSQVIQGQQ